jgi:hypothetical protein
MSKDSNESMIKNTLNAELNLTKNTSKEMESPAPEAHVGASATQPLVKED